MVFFFRNISIRKKSAEVPWHILPRAPKDIFLEITPGEKEKKTRGTFSNLERKFLSISKKIFY